MDELREPEPAPEAAGQLGSPRGSGGSDTTRDVGTDRLAARHEQWFLAWRLLPQLAYTLFFAVLQIIGAIVMKNVLAAWGLPLMAVGAWLIVAGSRNRQRRLEGTLNEGKELNRSGFYLPYLGWLIQLVGSIGPLMTWG